MIYGNQQSQESLASIVKTVSAHGKTTAAFVILTGHSQIGKTSIAKNVAQDVLGQYYMQDFLFVPDLSKQIGKKHAIKVWDTAANAPVLESETGEKYNDIGMRDIVYWLQKSAAWWKKILLLENIERMTNAAANAFLKAAEEPQPGVIIIATATHKSQIMDTILSRAITIPFQDLTSWDMELYIQNKGIEFPTPAVKEVLLSMAMGRPGVLEDLINNTDEDLQMLFSQTMQSVQINKSLQDQYTYLSKLHKLWYLQIFIDAWIYKISQENPEKTQWRLSFKKQLQTNVSIDRLLLNTIIS